jgi:hypothetical protein
VRTAAARGRCARSLLGAGALLSALLLAALAPTARLSFPHSEQYCHQAEKPAVSMRPSAAAFDNHAE